MKTNTIRYAAGAVASTAFIALIAHAQITYQCSSFKNCIYDPPLCPSCYECIFIDDNGNSQPYGYCSILGQGNYLGQDAVMNQDYGIMECGNAMCVNGHCLGQPGSGGGTIILQPAEMTFCTYQNDPNCVGG